VQARELGADHVIDHYQQDISAEVRKITAKRGVDVGTRPPGRRASNRWLPPAAWSPAAPPRANDAKIDLRFLFSRRLSLLGSFMGNMGELHRVLVRLPRAVETGDRPGVYGLLEIRAAHERLEGKEQFWRVLVEP
jgi:NADPH:quinone reductase-like Zn-dependent oxidoreductase